MATESWRSAYRELVDAAVEQGYPEEFGTLLAKNLGSERAMRRMAGYLRQARPQSVEEIADEMLAIMSVRDRWAQTKQAERANSAYTEFLNRER